MQSESISFSISIIIRIGIIYLVNISISKLAMRFENISTSTTLKVILIVNECL